MDTHKDKKPFDRERNESSNDRIRNGIHSAPRKQQPEMKNGRHGKPAFSQNSSRSSGKQVSPAHPVVPLNKTSRFVALMAVEDVMNKDTYASMALDARFSEANLSQADKRLAASITYRTLENTLRIDGILDQFLEKREELPQLIQDVLRISVCQIFFHDRLPENAIVDEAVKIVRFLKNDAFTGLVNGVLRNILRSRDQVVTPSRDDLHHYLSVMYSVPEWLTNKLIEGYGSEIAEKICAYRKDKHYITLRPNMNRFADDGAFEREILSKKVWSWEKGKIPHSYHVFNVSDVARDADYLNGSFSVQGESSMACVMATGVRPGMKVLDCCAAPGGKTAYIAELMRGTGRIYAWDLHDHRVALIRAMQKRLGLENIRPAVRDALIPKEDLKETLDLVLLDAPCSNLGVMDDKPDVKLRVSPESVQELVETQRKLMDVCSGYVKKGGTFIYSTCSILPEENIGQVRDFLARHPEFKPDMSATVLPESVKQYCGEDGLQLLSCRDEMEGFFIARLRKT